MLWQLQEAKSKFSKLVNSAIDDGPQIVTRHGEKVVVVLSFDEFQDMQEETPSLLSALLNSPLRGSEIPIPERDRSDFGRELLDL